MGEVASDFFAHHINPIIAVAISGLILICSLILQITRQKYVAWIYWLNVIMVSVFGTMVADVLHVGFGIPYIVSTIFFIIMLSTVLLIWHNTEGTLSIHSIHSRPREFFYWATVLCTFALGTAAGVMTATTLNLGYFLSGILFTLIFTIPIVCYVIFDMNEIFTFWFAYIITRPLGASFADWMGVTHSCGGLGIGTGYVALFLTIFIIGLVAYITITGKDINANETDE